MTAFTVICSNDAQNQLASIWLAATDRAAVTTAQHRLEQELASDPRRRSKEISEGLWGIDYPPLRALFEIDEPNRLVRITAIGRI